jgi:hypothetical protein
VTHFKALKLQVLSGHHDDVFYFATHVVKALAPAIADVWIARQRTGNSGWVNTALIFSVSLSAQAATDGVISHFE